MEQYQRMLAMAYNFAEKNMPQNPYHNFRHAEDVFQTVRDLALREHVGEEDRFLLETAALLHDIVYVIGRKDNEEKSAEVAARFLPAIGYSPQHAEKIKQLILATKFPANPSEYLEKVLCDADVANFGRPDFFERGEEIRQELGLENNLNWRTMQKSLLEKHRYYTESAKALRAGGIQANIAKLEELIAGYSTQ